MAELVRLTVAEAAERRGVPIKTIQNWVRNKQRPLRAFATTRDGIVPLTTARERGLKVLELLVEPEDLDGYEPAPVGNPLLRLAKGRVQEAVAILEQEEAKHAV